MAALIPLAVPATALAAWLDARYKIAQDLALIKNLVSMKITLALRDRHDRVNAFYDIESHAINTPDAVQLWYAGREWTFKQGLEILVQHGNWLKDTYGVKKGDIVALNCINKPEFLWFWWGLWSIGATPAFINYNLRGAALLHSIKTSSANLVLLDREVDINGGEVKREIEEGVPGSTVLSFDESTEAIIAGWRKDRPADSERSGVVGTDQGILIYTSGTTGLPKPAIVAWAKCSGGQKFCANWMGVKKTDRYYTAMPLYHGTATLLCALVCVYTGSTIVLGHKFSTSQFFNEARASRATIIQYVGETCRYLLANPPGPLDKEHNIRIAFGNGLRQDIWEPFRQRFGIKTIAEFYGATEGPSATWNLNTNSFSNGAISTNGAVLGAMLKLQTAFVEIDHDTEQIVRLPETGFCKRVGRGEPGELLYKLDEKNIDATFKGYYGNKKASESKIMRDVFKKGDAWFRSGDVITWTENGLMFFNDRIGDTYRFKSENVSTTQVSNCLNLFPHITDSCVYGVPLPGLDGNAGVAAIVLATNTPPSSALFDELLEYLNRELPRFAVPSFLRVVKEIEYTGNNKVMKGGLRKMGVDGEGLVWWLNGGRYEPYGKAEHEKVQAGLAKI